MEDNTLDTCDEVTNESCDKHFVDLKNGIDVNELIPDHNIEFEIDPDKLQEQLEDEVVYFDQEDIFHQLNMECLNVNEESSEDESLSPFARMEKDMIDISPAKDNGILKKVLKEGTGSVVPANGHVKVHYNGYLEYSDEPFDSTRLRGEPFSFVLGQGTVIKAWDIGVATMKKGELARFITDYPYAYGPMGCPPRIPRKSKVMFEIELIWYSKQSPERSDKEESNVEQGFEEVLKRSLASKQAGNDAFQKKRTMAALKHYLKGLTTLENANVKDESEEARMKREIALLCLNISQCHLIKEEGKKAARFSRRALNLDSSLVKGHYRLGKALKLMGEFTDARRHLLIAQRKLPNNKEITEELADLDRQSKRFKAIESKTSAKMLSLDDPPKGKNVVSGEDGQSEDSKEIIKLTEDRIKMFVKDESLNELPLQLQLTSKEVRLVENLVKKYGISLSCVEKENQTIYKLRKTAQSSPSHALPS